MEANKNIWGADTENRTFWYKLADDWENYFCDKVAPKYGINARINERKQLDPTLADLEIKTAYGWEPVELKPQFTPFFMAKSLYSVNPQYAFSLNTSDFNEYRAKETGYIIFWVDWKQLKLNGIKVKPMVFVGCCSYKYLEKTIINLCPPVHIYERREGKKGNAKSSFIFDIRNVPKRETL